MKHVLKTKNLTIFLSKKYNLVYKKLKKACTQTKSIITMWSVLNSLTNPIQNKHPIL